MTSDDSRLITALRAGDERAFASLIDRHHGAMLRLARTFVPTDAVAEEVVQETWLAVLGQLDRFEGRSTLKTWLFRILVNRAKTRGVRERRTVPFSALSGPDDDGRMVDERTPAARPWCDPERRLDSLERRAALRAALAALPARQRVVVTLRDVEGLDAEEVCDLLEISQGNQRLLLHRARGRLREQFVALEEPAAVAA
jgi:RNA polymerase sigma-70 factor, ECF subfamily